jgi:sulfane dehydrogenase subunit SoxC
MNRLPIEREPLSDRPLNAATPLPALAAPHTPPGLFYVRSHYDPPAAGSGSWRLRLGGAVERARTFELAELGSMPRVRRTVTLECAGNGRRRMQPVPPGTPWDLGAVSTAEFGGVPLHSLLLPSGVAADAVEVLFRGEDGAPGEPPYERSLPLAVALQPDVLVATEMNGEPLPEEHGHPVRLVVPGWYAMASVKWLAAIEVRTEPFHGHFQTADYVYLEEDGIREGTPVTRMRVRSVIASPAADRVLEPGRMEVRGTAWSGDAAVVRVDVSTDGGAAWAPAQLEPPTEPFAAQPWRLDWTATPGAHTLIARAADAAGNVQPLDPRWNRLGYGNNVCHRVPVTVRGADGPRRSAPIGNRRNPGA